MHFTGRKVEIDTGADEPLTGRVLEIVGDDFPSLRECRLRVLLHRGKILNLPMSFALAEHIWITSDNPKCRC